MSACPHCGQAMPVALTLPGLALAPSPRLSIDQTVEQALAHWAAQPYHARPPKLTPPRRARMRSRVAEGFTLDELKAAATNALHDPWLMGSREGARPEGYKDVEHIFRDAGQVERLRDLTATPPPLDDMEPPPSPEPRKGWQSPMPQWAKDRQAPADPDAVMALIASIGKPDHAEPEGQPLGPLPKLPGIPPHRVVLLPDALGGGMVTPAGFRPSTIISQ